MTATSKAERGRQRRFMTTSLGEETARAIASRPFRLKAWGQLPFGSGIDMPCLANSSRTHWKRS
jgi:hypothetical protein